jgi:hypothetical protein
MQRMRPGDENRNRAACVYRAVAVDEEGDMRKLVLAVGAGMLIAVAGAAPAAAVCPAAPAGEPGRSEFAQDHIVPLAHAGLLGHQHKPGTHLGASDCRALSD